MALKAVLEILEERGLELQLGPDGGPRLRGPRDQATPALLEAVKAYRPQILAMLQARRPREFLWRFGQKQAERPGDSTFGRPAKFPTGAWWWRREGEPAWQAIPGTPAAEGHPLPEGA